MSKTETRRKHSHLLWAALSVFVCFCIFSIAKNCVDIVEGKDNLKEIKSQIEIVEAENNELNKMIEDSDLDSYVVKTAHEKLDYVFPDERVYYDQQLADN